MTYNPRAVENLGSSTDNGIVRFDGTTGLLVQDSAITIDDSGNITLSGTIDGVDVSAHASRHIAGGADEIDGDQLDIDFVPGTYTRTTTTEADQLYELTAHLKGIDNALAARVVGPGSATDTAVALFDGTTGKLVKNSTVLVGTDFNVGTRKITNVTDPTSPQDAATKAYVDATATGLDVKQSVRVATTANITLSNTQTVDGVSLNANDRVLVKSQSTASENGIYIVVSGGSWTRATDADANAEVTSGLFTFVEEGTVNGDTGWVLTTDNPITVGTTGLAFAQFSGAGSIQAGDGLLKTGNTIDVVAGNGIAVAADSVSLQLDGSTLSLSGSGVKVADAGITATQLATSVAGDGLTGGGGTALAVGGTTDRISVSANAVDISANYVGQTSITTLGTVATGTWSATTIAVNKGGTGLTSTPTSGQLLIGNNSNGYTLGTLTDGTAITITEGNGSITIDHAQVSTGDLHQDYLLAAGTRALSGNLSAAGNRITQLAQGVSTKTSAYTVTLSDDILLGDANGAGFIFTLPAASTATGRVFNFKKIDSTSNTVTVARAGSDTIDGANTYVLNVQYESVTIVSNGTNWYVI